MKRFLFLLSLLVTTPAALAQSYATTCTREYWSSVNVRTQPSTRATIIASVPNESYVRVMGWVYGADGLRWYRIEHQGIVGFARSDYLCR